MLGRPTPEVDMLSMNMRMVHLQSHERSPSNSTGGNGLPLASARIIVLTPIGFFRGALGA
jgi:hypothetical protein